MQDSLQKDIDAYLEKHWDEVIADLDALVHIPSVEQLDAAEPNAPYGPGPRAALSKALSIAERMGLSTHDCEGHIGYADLAGESETQIGIIGHVDVVPAGPGWNYEPYAVTRKDGYLLGRGVADDKGPIVTALHAVKFWHDQGAQLPYTIRVLFGANEETNMGDVKYYRAHHDDPAFLFTPDAEFPVCYGEAGICSGTLSSAPIEDGAILSLEGGVAVNAVPGLAEARVAGALGTALAPKLAAYPESAHDELTPAPDELSPAPELAPTHDELAPSSGITVEQEGASTLVRAHGKSAHASTPHLGTNAIDLLAEFLLSSGCLTSQEESFLQLVRLVTSCYDGSGMGLQARDEHFGELTAVGGTIKLVDSRLQLTIDFRYPTTIASADIERRVNEIAQRYGARFEMQHDKTPFLMNPDSPAVQALLNAYNEATGENAEPFTMKGGTYARVFSTGVSFGPEKPWEEKPDWVGSMHGPDEGIREGLLKQAFAIYVRTIGKLMELDLR